MTKENTGAKKRAQSQATSTEDITLEEGLLANQEGVEEADTQKGAISIPLREVMVSKEDLSLQAGKKQDSPPSGTPNTV